MNRENLIKTAEVFVRDKMKEYDSGHDWWHIERVRKLAGYINDKEKLADPFVVDLAALLHDSADKKFAGDNFENNIMTVAHFMDENGLSDTKEQIIYLIKKVSFSSHYTAYSNSDSLLMVIQDADRLDAIGAIGIARAFSYGGFRSNLIYNPDVNISDQKYSTIGHFYDKLLKLKDLMNTETARGIAEQRHHSLKQFLDQFYKEWYFTDESKIPTI